MTTTTPEPGPESLTSQDWETLYDLTRRVAALDPDAWPETVEAARYLSRIARDYKPGGRYFPYSDRVAWADSRNASPTT